MVASYLNSQHHVFYKQKQMTMSRFQSARHPVSFISGEWYKIMKCIQIRQRLSTKQNRTLSFIFFCPLSSPINLVALLQQYQEPWTWKLIFVLEKRLIAEGVEAKQLPGLVTKRRNRKKDIGIICDSDFYCTNVLKEKVKSRLHNWHLILIYYINILWIE